MPQTYSNSAPPAGAIDHFAGVGAGDTSGNMGVLISKDGREVPVISTVIATKKEEEKQPAAEENLVPKREDVSVADISSWILNRPDSFAGLKVSESMAAGMCFAIPCDGQQFYLVSAKDYTKSLEIVMESLLQVSEGEAFVPVDNPSTGSVLEMLEMLSG